MAKTLSILEAFVLNDTKHEVNIIWEDDEPLIRATDIGKVLGIKHIHTSLDKFKSKHKVYRTVSSSGGPQETLHFTEAGLYKMLMISRKPIAESFQDWIEDVIKNIRKTGKYELDLQKADMEKTIQDKIEIALKAEALKNKFIEYQAKHDALIYANRNKNVVYFGYVELNEERVKIKIGSTDDISGRSKTHTDNFKTYYLFHVMETPLSERFEQFLHKHDMIKPFQDKTYTYLDKNNIEHHTIEIYDIEKSYVNKILEVAKRNHIKFKDVISIDKIITYNNQEIEKTKELSKVATLEYNTLVVKSAIIMDTLKNPIPIQEPIYIQDTRKITVGRGPKIQIYDPETSKLIHTFSCLVEPTRENEFVPNCSKAMIQTAINTNILYKKYRWMRLDRELSDDHIQELPTEISKTKTVNIGFIAMLNLDKTRVENVFPDILTATTNRQFKSDSAISKAIHKQTKSGGHYFMMWDDCEEELQEEYLSHDKLPEKPIRSNSVQINQLNAITGEIIKTYKCTEDVIKEFRISRKSLKNAIESNYVCKGFKWEKLI